MGNKLLNLIATLIVAMPVLAVGVIFLRGGFLPEALRADVKPPILSQLKPLTASPAPKPFKAPYISITFDDGWRSSYDQAAPLLSQFDFAGTYYLMSDYFGLPGYLTIEQANHLSSLGHQIAAHTATHADLAKISPESLEYELKDSKQKLEQTFGQISDFASPYGSFNEPVIGQIKSNYRSHRNTIDQINTAADFDIYQINAFSVTNQTTLSDLKNWLSLTKKESGWLVLNYHQIDDSNQLYAINRQQFVAQLETIRQSDITVVRLDKFLDTWQDGMGDK